MAYATEKNMIADVSRTLVNEGDLYAPMQVLSFDLEPALKANGSTYRPDARIVFTWQGRAFPFLIEIKARTAPSMVEAAIARLNRYAEMESENGEYPMLMVPYLSPTVVSMLDEANLNGIDPNGNYFIQLPDLLAIRLDRKNRFKEKRPIKNVFSGNSALVGRFLLREEKCYARVSDVYEGIKALGGSLSLSTVSKVLKVLEEELIVEKGDRGVCLLQPRKLLQQLKAGYRAPQPTQTLRLKLPATREEKEAVLDDVLGAEAWIWSGESSAEAYTVTTSARIYSAYTPADLQTGDGLRNFEDSRFYNCELYQTQEASVYFDRNGRWSSMLECYLALSQLDKREQEIAQEIEAELLNRFG